jgi:hypothetical protein
MKIINKGIILPIAIVIMVLLFGCLFRTDIIISESRHFPKDPNFTIPIQDYNNKNIGIDFNAIYYYEHETVLYGVSRFSYNYYRFWPNGRVLLNYSNQLPTKEMAENFTNAYIGYYNVERNKLIVELFVPDTGRYEWNYLRVEATIEDNKIIEKLEDGGKFSQPSELSFIKHNLGKLNRTPDW